ncbi:N-acetyltransferase [Arsukibacterium indicum]|uniref:N-acetyltransferase n=1 Tax=Arsukibacterium indicum TaxID=2848612 RepID=A0ABS6MH70_9GAMM|nr:N-acetyltransferase [Arsukibacterium indicum]MBV2127714.1 N-acetyltransferase [Arsukibacterium indicum]
MLAKIKQTYRELGAADTVLYMLDKALVKLTFNRLLIHKYYITRQPVSAIASVPPTKALDIEIKQLANDDPTLSTMDRPAAILQQRYAQGGHCFAAFKKEQFAGNLWLNFDEYQEDEVRCRYVLQPTGHAAWDYDVFVMPKYRFSYVFAKLWDKANSVMTGRGISYVYSRINYYNVGSLQSHKRLGSKIYGAVYFINIGSVQLMFSRHFKPFLKLSTNQAEFPALYIRDNPSNE